MVTRLMTLHTSLTATSTELPPRASSQPRELLAAGERSEPWVALINRGGVGRPLARRE